METLHYDTVNANTRKYTYTWMLAGMLKYPKTILVLFGLLTVFFGIQIPNLPFHFSIYDLIVEKLPETHAYHRHFRTFGSEKIIRIIFKTQHVYDPFVFDALSYVVDVSGRMPGINRVIGLPHYRKKFASASQEELGQFEKRMTPVTSFQKEMVSPDKKVTSVILFLSKDADHDTIIKQTNRLLTAEKISPAAYLTGIPIVNQAIKTMIRRDGAIFSVLLVLITTLALTLLVRRIMPVLLMLASIIASHVWTLGIISLLNLPISFLSALAPLFLLGVQTAFGLHVIASCSGNYQAISTPMNKVIIAFDKTTFPFILAIMTTLLGLLSFLFNPINSINAFGLLTFLGMLTFLLMMFTFFPLMLSVLPKTIKARCTHIDVDIYGVNHVIHKVLSAPNRQRYILPIFVGVTLACLPGLIRTQIETNPIMLFKEDTDIVKNYQNKYHYMSADFPICVTLKSPQKNYFFNPQHIKTILEFQNFIENLPGVIHTASLADHLKLLNYASHAQQVNFYRLPEDLTQFKQPSHLTKDLSKRRQIQAYINSEFSKANIFVNASWMDYHQLQRLLKAIERHAGQKLFYDIDINVTGMGTALLASNHHMIHSQFKSLLITLLMIFGILWFFFHISKNRINCPIPNDLSSDVYLGYDGLDGS